MKLIEKVREYAKLRGIKTEEKLQLTDIISYEEYLQAKGVEDSEKERKLYSALAQGIYPYVIQVIVEKIGRNKYYEALKKNQELNKHLFETLHILGILPYHEQVKLIEESLKWLFGDEIIAIDPSKITIIEGKFYYGGEEVEVKWIPSLLASKKQVIVSIEAYNALQRLKEEKANKVEEELPFTFEEVIREAYLKGASDVHVLYDADGYYHVFFRIDSFLFEEPKFLLDEEKGQRFIKKIKIEAAEYTKGKVYIDDLRKIWDARIEYENLVGTEGVDVRLVFIPDGKLRHQEVVARILRKQKIEKKTLEELGYYPEDAKVINKASKRMGGLFIISGITNSGKSTTLATIVASLPSYKKIETIEDPIEYVIPNPNVCQHQVYEPPDESEKVSFNEYVKGFKRADPDVIMISEIRKNPELVSALIEASKAGQTIFSTIHVNSAFEIYRAFTEMFGIEKATIISIILFSMNQMLVPKLCENCKVVDEKGENIRRLEEVKDELPFAVLKPLEDFLREKPKTYVAKGCEKCKGTGYSGRTLIYEYFYPNVKFIEWLSQGDFNRYEIEKKVYELGIGKNKLDIFIRRLREGIIDVSDFTMKSIM